MGHVMVTNNGTPALTPGPARSSRQLTGRAEVDRPALPAGLARAVPLQLTTGRLRPIEELAHALTMPADLLIRAIGGGWVRHEVFSFGGRGNEVVFLDSAECPTVVIRPHQGVCCLDYGEHARMFGVQVGRPRQWLSGMWDIDGNGFMRPHTLPDTDEQALAWLSATVDHVRRNVA